ncbi:competence protein, partial [Aquicoccus sp. SCR17]|nr:competence protein [Carideicomes alvinocaridis]
GGLRLRHLHGVRAARAFAGCGRGELVVTDRALEGATACDVYGPARLARTGSVAIMPDGRRLTAREVSGRRPWTGLPR